VGFLFVRLVVGCFALKKNRGIEEEKEFLLYFADA
jgi:hypothetical protein